MCIYINAYTQQTQIFDWNGQIPNLMYQAVSRVTKHDVLKDPPLVDILHANHLHHGWLIPENDRL